MTGPELEAARATLGEMWGLPGPLPAAELARILHIERRDPGARIRLYETGGDAERRATVPGPVAAAVSWMLDGYVPPEATKLIGPDARLRAVIDGPRVIITRRRGQ